MENTEQIDDIVEAILTLARRRPGKDLVSNIEAVKVEIRLELLRIMSTDKERKEDK